MELIINLRVIASVLILLSPALAQDSRFCFDEDCCVDLDEASLLGDLHDCKMYFQCFGDIPLNLTCSIETPYFNPASQLCESDIPNGCVGGTRLVSLIDGNCTEEGVYYVPYPGDCKKYMICSGATLIPDVFECPSGTLFDPEIKECNLEASVTCKPTCPQTGVINLPYNGDCSKYWLCALGEAIEKACPPGLKFDPILGSCNVEQQVLCPNLCPLVGVDNLPHSDNCSLYWLCVSGAPTLKSCTQDLYFDTAIKQCNVNTAVDCGTRPTPTTPAPTPIPFTWDLLE